MDYFSPTDVARPPYPDLRWWFGKGNRFERPKYGGSRRRGAGAVWPKGRGLKASRVARSHPCGRGDL